MEKILSLLDQRYYWLLLAGVLLAGCRNAGQQAADAQDTSPSHAQAIRLIIAQDEELGAIRNQACEDTSLSVTIQQYVAGIDSLDFSDCPPEFTTAFRNHRDAWKGSIGFFGQYDSLRGEMHLLFETIEQEGAEQKAAYERELGPIMNTWAEVEAAARKYGAIPEE